MTPLNTTPSSCQPDDNFKLIKLAMILVVSCLAIRALSLGLYPLMDTTEARYGEMARIMAETGDWITPMFDYDIPFWGKPPMFTWLSASGFELLDHDEFSARFPHFFIGLLTLWLVWIFARTKLTTEYKIDSQLAWLSTAILASTASFIVITGAVMTDASLMLSITLSMTSFWCAWHTNKKKWGYFFFVGLALGMLSKGPLALVLVGISLAIWLTLTSNWKALWSKIPWISGTLLFCALSLPWYIAAEIKTPGFLDYFIIGEHVKRFLISGWEGDLYGTAHKRPRGTIWLLWLLASLPWFPVLFYQIFKLKKKTTPKANNSSVRIFLWSWLLAPLLLFTFSGNILWSYVLPGIPALALLIGLNQKALKLPAKSYAIGLAMPIALAALVIALIFGFELKGSEKDLLKHWNKHAEKATAPLYYLNKRPFSAQFYSDGQAQLYKENPNHLTESHFLAVRKASSINQALKSQCELLTQNKQHLLWFCNKQPK